VTEKYRSLRSFNFNIYQALQPVPRFAENHQKRNPFAPGFAIERRTDHAITPMPNKLTYPVTLLASITKSGLVIDLILKDLRYCKCFSHEVAISMISSALDANPGAKGFLFDGFPRTVAQAEALDKLLKLKNGEIGIFLSLQVSGGRTCEKIIEPRAYQRRRR